MAGGENRSCTHCRAWVGVWRTRPKHTLMLSRAQALQNTLSIVCKNAPGREKGLEHGGKTHRSEGRDADEFQEEPLNKV